MLLHICSLDELEIEAEEMEKDLLTTVSEDGDMAVAQGTIIMVHLARSGKMLADAKYHQDEAVKNSIINELAKDIPPSVLKKLVEAACKRENYIVTWVGRINATCSHQLDFLRTIISKAKSEYDQTKKPLG